MIFLMTADYTPDLGLIECAVQWLSLHSTTQVCKGCRQACLRPLHVSTLLSCHNPIHLYVKSASHNILHIFFSAVDCDM